MPLRGLGILCIHLKAEDVLLEIVKPMHVFHRMRKHAMRQAVDGVIDVAPIVWTAFEPWISGSVARSRRGGGNVEIVF